VAGGVPQDVEAVLVLERDGLDRIAGTQRPAEIRRRTVEADRDDIAPVTPSSISWGCPSRVML
jgi:hypothetical protein